MSILRPSDTFLAVAPRIKDAMQELENASLQRVRIQNEYEMQRKVADQAVMMARQKLSALVSIASKS